MSNTTETACDGGSSEPPARIALMRACALATETELEGALAAVAPVPTAVDVRPPEFGLVMLRGRMGGDGAPFNVGEATVTRAVVRLQSGAVGFSYLLGRAPKRARLAAIIDALGQDMGTRAALQTALVAPVMTRRAQQVGKQRAEVAATRVNFFTVVRGEDA